MNKGILHALGIILSGLVIFLAVFTLADMVTSEPSEVEIMLEEGEDALKD